MSAPADITVGNQTLADILAAHGRWLRGESGGERANLRWANLSGVDLNEVDLSWADLRWADLRGADLYGANLSRADLRGAELRGANLREANLTEANLNGAYLLWANLSGADLRWAELWGAVGNMSEIKSIQLDRWTVTYTAEVMQIGCQSHPIADWWAFDDERIDQMDRNALAWWRKWKPVLQQIIEISPATPTGGEAQ